MEIDVVLFGLNLGTETIIAKSFAIEQKWTIKDFLQNFKATRSGKFHVYKKNKVDKATASTPITQCILDSEIYVKMSEKPFTLISIREGKEQIIQDSFYIDQSMSVEDFVIKVKQQLGISCQVISKNKKKVVRLLPILQFITNQKIYVKTSFVQVKVYLTGSTSDKPLKTIEVDENKRVSDLIKELKDEYGLNLVILDHDKTSQAALNQKISKYISESSIYAKQSTMKVKVFCEQNSKLPSYSINVDLNSTIQDFKKVNKYLDNYHIVDKSNSVVQGEMKLMDVAELKQGSYYIRYKEYQEQQAKKIRMAEMRQNIQKLQKINQSVKDMAGKHSEKTNKQIAEATEQMQKMMSRLTKDVSFIHEKDFNLQEKIRHVEKGESGSFISRMYKVADLYTTDLLLEENQGRIFWPYFKTRPFIIRKRIIDFKKSVVETTNSAHYEERQTTTHSQLTVKTIERSITEHMNKIQVAAKVGVSTAAVKVNLEASYLDDKSDMTDKEDQTMESNSQQYIIYNALKMTEAYHIDQQNIALKQSIRNNVKKLYQAYEQNKASLKNSAISFFKNYGTHLQIGKYLFGCRYGFNSKAHSHQKTTKNKLATISRMVKSVGVSGSMQAGNLFCSGSGGFSFSKTDSTNTAKLSEGQKAEQSYSFEINYNLQGIEIKNRDSWRELSGIYKKGWKLMGFEDIRLVRIVDILRNDCNRINNPSYKRPYDQFLDELSQIEINIQVNDYQFNEKGELRINLGKDGKLSAYDTKNIVQFTSKYIKQKSISKAIVTENIFMEKVREILESKEQLSSLRWVNNDQIVIVSRQIINNATINERILQMRVQMKKN